MSSPLIKFNSGQRPADFPEAFKAKIGTVYNFNDVTGKVIKLQWAPNVVMVIAKRKTYFGINLILVTDDGEEVITPAINSLIECEV